MKGFNRALAIRSIVPLLAALVAYGAGLLFQSRSRDSLHCARLSARSRRCPCDALYCAV